MYTNRFFTVLVIMALAAIITLTVREAIATSAVASNAEEALRIQRSRDAETARWQAMGEYYENLEEAQNIQRGRDADAARWTAMAEYYTQILSTAR